MAAEIGDPNFFQVENLSSGSVSFGRFETESLSWERKSSFSRNVYLEEVEKFSKPGSVTEKKAYFEAHFKRKALLSQSSTGSQSSNGCEVLENDSMCHAQLEESKEGLEVSQSCHSHYTDVADESDEHDYVIVNSKQIDEPISQEFPMNYIGSMPLWNNLEQIGDTDAANHYKAEHRSGVFDNDSSEEKRLENVDSILSEYDHRDIDISPKPPINGNCTIENHEHMNEQMTALSVDTVEEANPQMNTVAEPLLKVEVTTELETTHLDFTQNLSDAAHDGTITKQGILRPGETSIHTKTRGTSSSFSCKGERHSTSKASASSSPIPNQLKSSENRNIKTSVTRTSNTIDRRPGKSKAPCLTHCSSPNGLAGGVATSRSKVVCSADMKQENNGIKLKSEERAARRKEFNMKLGEKIQQKEAAVNQIQAEIQEKFDAEIKQLRKSLNFKATPMPSFYQETASRTSSSKKAVQAQSSLRSQRTNVGVDPKATKSSCLSHASGQRSQIRGEKSPISVRSSQSHLDMRDPLHFKSGANRCHQRESGTVERHSLRLERLNNAARNGNKGKPLKN